MEDSKINTLLNEEKYDDAINLMKQKYIELFKKMLDKKNVEEPKNDDFYCYTSKVITQYPNLKGHIDFLRKGILDKDFNYLNEVNLLKNTYSYLVKNY